eukprot:210904-Pelagomonas_calceolata.AAC.1
MSAIIKRDCKLFLHNQCIAREGSEDICWCAKQVGRFYFLITFSKGAVWRCGDQLVWLHCMLEAGFVGNET